MKIISWVIIGIIIFLLIGFWNNAHASVWDEPALISHCLHQKECKNVVDSFKKCQHNRECKKTIQQILDNL